jgi:hypothetical protein
MPVRVKTQRAGLSNKRKNKEREPRSDSTGSEKALAGPERQRKSRAPMSRPAAARQPAVNFRRGPSWTRISGVEAALAVSTGYTIAHRRRRRRRAKKRPVGGLWRAPHFVATLSMLKQSIG